MPLVTLDQQLKRVRVAEFELDNAIVFGYFDQLPATERDDALLRALYMGVLALMEDRLAAFLAKTESELGVRLEALKLIFEMKKEVFFRSTQKGTAAEEEIASALNSYFSKRGLRDSATLVGNVVGDIENNKTGDIVCLADGREDRKVVVECKFDRSIRLGPIEKRDVSTKRMDTVWSQLLEARVNRGASASLIVFDAALIDSGLYSAVESVAYIHDVGFIAIVDSQKGDYSNLFIAYMLARDVAINSQDRELDGKTLTLLMERLVSDVKECLKVQELVKRNIQISKEILAQLQKGMLMLEFTQEYILKFIRTGKLTSEDMLQFYLADEVRQRYASVEKDIYRLL